MAFSLVGGEERREKSGKQKARLGFESGLAVEISGFFQPFCARLAHDHRRQADPCQHADLAVVVLTR
jgi:hypothetical protein